LAPLIDIKSFIQMIYILFELNTGGYISWIYIIKVELGYFYTKN